MPLRPLLPWMLLALALGVAAIVLSAGRGDGIMTGVAAGAYALAVVAAGLITNAGHWSGGPQSEGAIRRTTAGNVWLAALVYAWGASALLAVYSLSGLQWRHGWQYGSGATLIAAGLAIFAATLERESARMPPLPLTLLHAIAVFAGLAYLVGAGKLLTMRADWVANAVFLSGGVAILGLCLVAAITQMRPTAPDPPQ